MMAQEDFVAPTPGVLPSLPFDPRKPKEGDSFWKGILAGLSGFVPPNPIMDTTEPGREAPSLRRGLLARLVTGPESKRGEAAASLGPLLGGFLRPPAHGEVNMWIGPRAKTYDHKEAARVKKDWEAYRASHPRLTSLDIQNFMVDLQKQGRAWIVEPATGTPLQYRTDTGFVHPNGMNKLVTGAWEAKLGEVLAEEGLLYDYPHLRDIPVLSSPFAFPGSGTYSPDLNRITVGPWTSEHHPSEILRHEVQHAIQKFEGLPGGSNPENYSSKRSQLAQMLYNAELASMQPGRPGAESKQAALALSSLRKKTLDQGYRSEVGERLAYNSERHLGDYTPDLVPDLTDTNVQFKNAAVPTSLLLRGWLQPTMRPSPEMPFSSVSVIPK